MPGIVRIVIACFIITRSPHKKEEVHHSIKINSNGTISNPRRAESIELFLYEIGSPTTHHQLEETIVRNSVQET